MIAQKIIENKVVFVLIIFFLVALHVSWDYFNGGVPTHYVLHRKDMPGISNWWQLLTIPLITYVVVSVLQKQYHATPSSRKLHNIQYGLFSGFAFGMLLSILWTFDLQEVMSYVIFIPLLTAFFIPVHYPQYLLGFVLGMTYTFGGVLSIGIGLILVLETFLVWIIFRKGIPYLFKNIFLTFNQSKNKS